MGLDKRKTEAEGRDLCTCMGMTTVLVRFPPHGLGVSGQLVEFESTANMPLV